MTAEIAVLNRQGIALAADSAVTLQHPKNPKIYHTNKLFALSKYHPIGIMVYGRAEFMGAPWELIIKDYRAKLGQRSFDRLHGCAEHFVNFIELNSSIFSSHQQEMHCYFTSCVWLSRLKKELIDVIKEKFGDAATILATEVKTIFRGIVDREISRLEARPRLPRFDGISDTALREKYSKVIRRAVVEELQNLRGAVAANRIEMGCILSIVRDLHWNFDSGVVIAGFGNHDFFPSLRCYQLESIIGGRLRGKEQTDRRIDISTNEGASRAVLAAYAQGEMVSLFMNGIDDDYDRFIKSLVEHSLRTGYPAMLSEILKKHVTPAIHKKVLRQLDVVGKKVIDALRAEMTSYERTVHSDPIVDIVNHLPKEELAAMAEALVNLTSLKRHVTREAETVGGPIDVAVISRGDGFIWIRRKHYFDRDLNPQFLANYFRDIAAKTQEAE